MESGDWITLGGIIGGLAAFVAGFFRYVRAQQWKTAEFVAKEIKEFESRPANRMVMQMLDWSVREVELFPEEEKVDERKVEVTDDILSDVLVPHTVRAIFSREEARIRDIFDRFLDDLERFEHFIQSGLVGPKDFHPYLIYWIEIIGDRHSGRKPLKFLQNIWSYIDFYGYSGVQKLFSRYGYDIRPSKDVSDSG